MRFRDVSIGGKMVLMAVILLSLLLLIGWQGFNGMKKVLVEAGILEKLLVLDATINKREVDHLSWASKVSDFLLGPSQTSLAVEKDQNNCKLGKWLNDREAMAGLAEVSPELRQALERIHSDHAKLHRSALTLDDTLAKAGNDRAAAGRYCRHGIG